MRKYVTLILLGLLCVTNAYAQPKFIKTIAPKFVRKMLFEKDSSRSASFFLLPVISSAPETGLELGASTLYSFYTDTSKVTRVSNVFAYGTFTTEGQQRVSVSSSYWTAQNRYHYTGLISYVNFPFNFYGIGNNTEKSSEQRISEKRLRINFSGEKRLGNWYLGYVAGGYNFTYRIDNTGKPFEAQLTSYDRNGGAGIFAGPNITFDNRNNNTYTTKGMVVNAYLNVMHGLFADNNYKGSFFNIEYAQFFSLSKRFIVGLNIQEQSLLGNQTPFYLLPELGNDEMMRGYYNGRYRDKNLLAGQTELRYRISDRIGIAAFAGTGTVFRNKLDLKQFKPNYGGGLRYFFDTEKGLTMRIDYGVGQQAAGEKRQQGFYMSLGEAF
ncbi:BamA/TamA family outer membrane protein [Mucilaginibacter aquatilis]|uniref:Polymerase n=1 Tax=Mucilaginibacter aquatilis TaxID=1517760 RepID=A0A6I4IA22_9SPHI|nr:polymerase [Mucilaginibacter aquatilis]MVN90326.1 polymerase [Mucilaginibacter aquatilis]